MNGAVLQSNDLTNLEKPGANGLAALRLLCMDKNYLATGLGRT